MDFKEIWAQHKELVVAVIAGVCTIAAAVIKRSGHRAEGQTQGKQKNPVARLVFWCFVCLLLGAAMLGAEMFAFNLDPDGGLGPDNPGLILTLAGCLLISTGAIWGVINFGRLLGGAGKPKLVEKAPVVKAAGVKP